MIRDFILTFAADKHNSITNKRKVARKNERNDNDNGQMPSGSKTNVKSKSVNRREDCILSFVG